MTGWLFALIARLHGHLALLGLALLLHPVITLRTRRGLGAWTRFSAELGAALLLVPFVAGWAIYPHYRTHVKPELLEAPRLAFEAKEHLGAMAVALAISGALVLRASARDRSGIRAAWTLLLVAWTCGAIAAVLGVAVAASAHPAW